MSILCKKSEDTTEHVLDCEKAKKFTLSIDNSKGKWGSDNRDL